MSEKDLRQLTDQERAEKAKKQKRTAILNAGLIGFLIGIVIYSVVKNGFGFFALIPLYFVYKLVNQSKKKEGV